VAPGDREAQAARCVDNLLAVLTEHGASADDLVKTTIFVVMGSREDLVAVWDMVESRLGRVPSTLLGVAGLGWADQLVEIEAIAVVSSPPGHR
jgi:enamine deaminase RidA (YjgF/YER057c/UK114 family)